MVAVRDLGKRFKLYSSPGDRLLEWISLGHLRRHEDFWALRDVTFEVRAGECLGIIGVNGAGKSTLLKILSRALYPTAGTFEVRGRVVSLLDLGTGFEPELTGRQNVFQSAQLLGFPEKYVRDAWPPSSSSPRSRVHRPTGPPVLSGVRAARLLALRAPRPRCCHRGRGSVGG